MPINANSEELAEILKQLTVEQIRFIVARQNVATDKEAARIINVNHTTVSKWGDLVKRAVFLVAQDGVTAAVEIRRRHLAEAMAVKAAGLKSHDERVRQSAATEIIEWELGKATQRQEHMGKDGNAINIVIQDNTDD